MVWHWYTVSDMVTSWYCQGVIGSSHVDVYGHPVTDQSIGVCVRAIIVGSLFLIGFMFALLVLAKDFRESRWSDRLAKLRAAIASGIIIESILGSLHYLVFAEPKLALWLKFTGMMCQVLVCYFFCALGLAITHQKACLDKVMLPMCIVLGIFNTVLISYGLEAWEGDFQCLNLVWTLFVVSQSLNAAVFFAASRLILPKIQRAPSAYRSGKAAQLKAIFWINFVSCVIVSLYEILNHYLTLDVCDLWWKGYTGWNTAIYVTIRSIEYIFPLGAIIWTFWNWRKGIPRIDSKDNSLDSTQQITTDYNDEELKWSISEKEGDEDNDDHPNPRSNPVTAFLSRPRPFIRESDLR
jgi:hypothetical protein